MSLCLISGSIRDNRTRIFGQIVGHLVGLEGKLGDVFLDDEVGVCLDVCERNPVGKENLIVFQAQLVVGGICRLEQMTEQGFEVLFGQQVDGGMCRSRIAAGKRRCGFLICFCGKSSFHVRYGLIREVYPCLLWLFRSRMPARTGAVR